jgi:hypothetical protein
VSGADAAPDDEHAATIRLLDAAVEELLERRAPRRQWTRAMLLLDPPDDPAEIGDGEVGAHGLSAAGRAA